MSLLRILPIGYFDLSMMRYLNKVYDFEKELRKLKKLRMQLLDKSKLDKIGKVSILIIHFGFKAFLSLTFVTIDSKTKP